ncbi:MAG: sulfatase-like hydrolase/transferase [Burkholderiales bacterium]|nr:sulfatase-like hydrolase/transferase [Burkholderiales bacterium]
MKPQNLIIFFSDEHNPRVLGAAGHPFIATPNLDALAARGTRFTQASTPCPICVPARAALALGRYNHEIGYWDNADAYEGATPSWHHLLRARGHRVVSIGKLHFRGRPGDDHGFSEERIPMHIVDGLGDLLGLNRGPDAPPRGGAYKMIGMAGPGESDYTRYDRDIAAQAQIWLREEAPKYADRPWVLFVSLVAPHFPLTAPPEHYYRYAKMGVPLPKQYAPEERPRHPYLVDYATTVPYDAGMKGPADVRRALSGYFGLVSFMDEQVGKVLAALEDTGLAASTRVLYTTDHGDNNGARGLWGKSTMYEESVGVPIILAGAEVPAGRVVRTPASLVDVFATVLDAVGADAAPSSGQSLLRLLHTPDADRLVFSEYHATASREAIFMVQDLRYKYVRCVSYPAQLFDRETDPEELRDVAADPAYAPVVRRMEEALRARLDPAEVDARAKRRQAEVLAAAGGWEIAVKRGDLPFSPPPGTQAAWS